MAVVWPPIADPTISCLVIDREPLAVALPARHPLARRRRLRPADLATEDVVSWPRANGPGLYDAIVSQVWADRPARIRDTQPDDEHMMRAVGEGTGIGVCVESKLRGLRVPGVVVRPFAPPAPTAALGMAWRTDTTNSAVRTLLEFAEQLVNDGSGAAGNRP